MNLRRGALLAILAAPAMGASILDVSAETSTAVQTGDTLTIQLFTWNYKVNAARQNQPLYPTDVAFDLVSSPLRGTVGFDATLESADGKASFALGGLTFVPGDLQSSGYTDDVSVLEGHRHLSLADSEALFSGPSIVIILRNEGPGFTLGLAPYLLRQDVFASLSGGTVSVGAIPDSVELESQDQRMNLMGFGGAASLADDSEVPEPLTGGLLWEGGLLLCGLSAVLARVSRARR